MQQLRFLKNLFPQKQSLDRQLVDLLLEDRIDDAVELGRGAVAANPLLLAMSSLVNLLADPESAAKRILFLASLRRIDVKPTVIWMLCRRGLLVRELQGLVADIRLRDHTYYLILKEILIKGHPELLNMGSRLECAESLLDSIDDWDLYQYALDNSLDLKPRVSLNHEFYLLHRHREQDRAARLLESRLCFREIKEIVGLVDLHRHPAENIDCVVQLVRSGFSEGLLTRAHEVYGRDTNVFNVKTLLAVLISSRKTNLLVLALYLSFLHKDMDPSNYEIQLVFAFLCRYFCFYPQVLQMFQEMKVKNAHVANMAFMWTDILIVRGIRKRNEFVETMKTFVADVDNGLRHLMLVGNLAHAVDALELRKRIVASVVVQEVEEDRIIGNNPSSCFSELLGEHCAYLFEKMTVDRMPRGRSILLTDHYVSAPEYCSDMLENRLCVIDSEAFLTLFREMQEWDWK